MNTSIVAHEEPHLTIRLKYEADEGEGQLELANQVITAVDALAADWLEPLAWDMYLGCLDAELMDTPMHSKPPQPYWLLRKEQIPAGVEVRPIHSDHIICCEPVLLSEPIRAWAARALAQTCADAPHSIPYWVGLDTLAIRARLPVLVDSAAHERLRVDCYAGTITIPVDCIDNQFWVSGPPEKHVIGPPVRLTASNLYGMVVDLDLAIYWSPWLNQPGRALVDAAVERVLALGRGWRRSED